MAVTERWLSFFRIPASEYGVVCIIIGIVLNRVPSVAEQMPSAKGERFFISINIIIKLKVPNISAGKF